MTEKRVPVQLAYKCTVYAAAQWGARPGRWVAGVLLAYEKEAVMVLKQLDDWAWRHFA